MSKWWAEQLNISDVRRALRDIRDDAASDDDFLAEGAAAALVHLRSIRGRLNFVDATGGLVDHGAHAAMRRAGDMILGPNGRRRDE